MIKGRIGRNMRCPAFPGALVPFWRPSKPLRAHKETIHEKVVYDRRHDGGWENDRQPNFEAGAPEQRIPGRGLVLGRPSLHQYPGDPGHGGG